MGVENCVRALVPWTGEARVRRRAKSDRGGQFCAQGGGPTAQVVEEVEVGGGRTRGSGATANDVKEIEGVDNNGEDKDGKIPILVSDALGTHLEGRLSAVEDLVERALNRS